MDLKGPFVGDVEQDIDWSTGSYTNFVRLGNGFVEGALTAEWENKSKDLWLVKFQGIILKVAGVHIVKKPLVATGTWRLTYIDENFRILYAQGGKNTVKENIYILAK